ncbi:uncharacterized protein LOC144546578 [Carex rostrata]
MAPLFFIFLVFLLSSTPYSAGRSINININSSTLLQFSSLAWDPIAQHFVAGSNLDSAVYAILETGTVKCVISKHSSNNSITGISTTAVAVDHVRQRLIVAFSNHSSVAAYDLKSYGRIFAVPLPELNGGPGGIAVDLESGEVFVTSARRGIVLQVGPEGDRWKVISEFKIQGNQGLGGLVHTSNGYIITVQPTTKKVFKVDYVKRTVEEVLSVNGANLLAQAGPAIVLRTNLSIAIATSRTILLVKSAKSSSRIFEKKDSPWEQADVIDKIKVGHGKTVVAVAMREGTTFVLTKSQGGYMIQEVIWRSKFLEDFETWGLFSIFLVCLLVMYWYFWQWTNGLEKIKTFQVYGVY